MIWSTKSAELRRADENLRTAKPPLLKTTDLLAKAFEERSIPFEPIRYIGIPPRAHTIGKMVIPYVVIDGQGRLNQNMPSFYGVTMRPDTVDVEKEVVSRRSREAHVVAEDLSLKRGLFTPTARANSEVLVAGMLAPAYIGGYVQDRVAHLSALTDEVERMQEQLSVTQHDILVEELTLAVDALLQFG